MNSCLRYRSSVRNISLCPRLQFPLAQNERLSQIPPTVNNSQCCATVVINHLKLSKSASTVCQNWAFLTQQALRFEDSMQRWCDLLKKLEILTDKMSVSSVTAVLQRSLWMQRKRMHSFPKLFSSKFTGCQISLCQAIIGRQIIQEETLHRNVWKMQVSWMCEQSIPW